MQRGLRRVFFWSLATLGFFLFLGWLVFEASLFSGLRRSIVSDVLSKAIGQQLIIETDVKAIVAPISHLTVSGVTIPSEGIDGTNLAELKLLELDVDLFALLSGSLRIDNIRIDGIRVILATQADGTTSWTDVPATPQNSKGPAPLEFDVENSIVAFLDDKDVNVTSVSLSVDNQVTGFEYLFELNALTLKQENQGDGESLASHGTVNGQPFRFKVIFRKGRHLRCQQLWAKLP